jgi:lysylphosphatidylglycerol synthetase-like protein (DUF2156 family)
VRTRAQIRRERREGKGGPGVALSPLRLALLLILALAGLSLLPRVSQSWRLLGAFWAAAAVLLVLLLVLRLRAARAGRALQYEFVPMPVHYVQATMGVRAPPAPSPRGPSARGPR